MGAGVTDTITSLLTRWSVAAWAGGTDVAIAFTVETLPEEVLWKDGTQAGMQVGIYVIFNMVDIIFKGVNFLSLNRRQGVMAQYYLVRY